MREPSRFERVMFVTLLPALALPIIAGAIAYSPLPDPVGEAESSLGNAIGYWALTVFTFLLLTSMTLNAWLLLRRHENLSTKSIPSSVGFALLVLYGTLGAWLPVLLFVPLSSGNYWYFVVAIFVESVAVFTLVVTTGMNPPLSFDQSSPSLDVPLSSPLRWGAVGYLALATVGVAFSIAMRTTQTYEDGSGYWIPLLVALGIPWFPVLLAVGYVVILVAGGLLTAGTGEPIVVTEDMHYLNLLVPTLVNMAIAVAVLASPSSRTMALRLLLLRGPGSPSS